MAELPDTEAGLAALLALSVCKGPVCLDFIDPYGHTVFNQLQLPHLVSEPGVARDYRTTARETHVSVTVASPHPG